MHCPICGTPDIRTKESHNSWQPYQQCPRCGEFECDAAALAKALKDKSAYDNARLSHYCRQCSDAGRRPKLKLDNIYELVNSLTLPSPKEQADSLLLLLGNMLSHEPHAKKIIQAKTLVGAVGAIDTKGLFWVARYLKESQLLDCKSFDQMSPTELHAGLTFEGWNRYELIKRGQAEGTHGFMAMQFNDPPLNEVFNKCFKMAADECGFNLRTVAEVPKAGLIDNLIRAEIRQSLFVVADLTHDNSGAYFEAGYAEGLGKPVIYTCRKKEFDTGTHFDTSHHQTIIWEHDDLETAKKKMVATLRVTLPSKAT